SDVDLVVISHHHGDHVGGLPYLARVSPGLLVYVPSGADPAVLRSIRSLGLEVTELDDPTELSNGVWTTGSMWGPPAEQGLIVNVSGLGAVLITGCAHPKVELMAQRAAEIADERLYAVLGGFHLGSATEARLEGIARVFRSLGVEFVAPLHCSGARARSFFREAMPSAYGDGHVGLALTFDRSGVSVEG
ncbi:MAG: MBL fold metallo-hydrolase, partial [Candidatus Korarchaeota archaeon]|nr:MBL fold metallo-hydrolase [Candidatus Korarchaeota archaeon]